MQQRNLDGEAVRGLSHRRHVEVADERGLQAVKRTQLPFHGQHARKRSAEWQPGVHKLDAAKFGQDDRCVALSADALRILVEALQVTL